MIKNRTTDKRFFEKQLRTMKGYISIGPSKVTPSNEFSSTSASENVPTNCDQKSANFNYNFNDSKFLILIQIFKIKKKIMVT